MLSTSGKRQARTSDRRISGTAATDTAFYRLSLVLKEIADSVVGGDREKTSVELTAGSSAMCANDRTEEGCD